MFSNKFKEDTTFIKDIGSLVTSANVVDQDITPLTVFGENFGSEILKVDLTVEDKKGERKVIHAVAKLIPPTEMQLEIFNTQVTFKNEIGFYADIVPTLHTFQREYGVPVMEYFPEMYGARISLDPRSDVVDTDAVLLLENLKVKGYANLDKTIGFDLEGTKRVLSVLAEFQATIVALRQKNPELFDTKFLKHTVEFRAPLDLEDLKFEPVLKENPATSGLVERVRKAISKRRVRKAREPWGTITHNDLWVNNIMVKENNGLIEDLKLVDFQVIDYASPLVDVLFFLFSSVPVSVLRYHLEKLLQLYHKAFVDTLEKYKIDTKEFSYESFLEEAKAESSYQLLHVTFMLWPIFTPKDTKPAKPPGKVPEWNPNEGASNGQAGPPKKGGMPNIPFTLPMKEKLWFIAEEYAKRNWI